jgi:hypothetical protein
MIYKLLIAGALLASSIVAATPKVGETVKAIRTLSKTDDFVNALRKLGTPDSIIAEYSKPQFAGSVELMNKPGAEIPLFTKAHFVRSETFRENLDADPGKEYVSQVVFATGSEKLDRKIFFVFIHDDDDNGNRLIGFKVFDEVLCDRTPESPMTFAFKKMSNSVPAKIEFTIVRTISCGDDISFYTVCDTMAYAGKSIVYRPGVAHDTVSSNRMQDLKEIEDQ